RGNLRGYPFKLPGSREPGAGSREPGAGSREPGAGSRAGPRRAVPRHAGAGWGGGEGVWVRVGRPS
ncbi:hypothetical protein E1261_26960, partial [Kribbella albertanoniae]